MNATEANNLTKEGIRLRKEERANKFIEYYPMIIQDVNHNIKEKVNKGEFSTGFEFSDVNLISELVNYLHVMEYDTEVDEIKNPGFIRIRW